MSQYGEIEALDVHHDNFRTPCHNEDIKMTSLAIGSYVGPPDDQTDFDLYNAIKTSVMSGGVNHIDTAPNFRYMKSEKVIGKVLNVLDRKYGLKRDQLIIASKGGYVPEDADEMIGHEDMVKKLIK